MNPDHAAPPLRVLIADDHALFRRGMREVIDAEDDMQVVAEAGDGEEAIRRARELRPHALDLVLLDLDMPGGKEVLLQDQTIVAEGCFRFPPRRLMRFLQFGQFPDQPHAPSAAARCRVGRGATGPRHAGP